MKNEEYYTFENSGNPYEEFVREPNSKERLRRANEYIQSLRRSSSSPRQIAKSSDFAQNLSKLEDYSINIIFRNIDEKDKSMNANDTSSNKVDMIKVEINELLGKMENASKSIFESYDVVPKQQTKGTHILIIHIDSMNYEVTLGSNQNHEKDQESPIKMAKYVLLL